MNKIKHPHVAVDNTPREVTLQRVRVIMEGDAGKASSLVSHLTDYVMEKNPERKRQLQRRFYARLNKKLKDL